LSKGALFEIIRAPQAKFEKMANSMHFTDKNFVVGELYKRAEILGESPLG
jgi:hypothetical protein